LKGVVVWSVRMVAGVCMGFSVKVFGEKGVVDEVTVEGEHGGTFTCSGAWWQGKVIVEED